MKKQVKKNTLKKRKEKISISERKAEVKFRTLKEQLSKLKKENKHLKNSHLTKKDSESKYRSLFEMSGDAILVIENETFVDCNKAVVKMLGYKNKKELLNTHPSELSPLKQPDGRLSFEKAEEMMALAIKNGSNHFEWIHKRSNNEEFPVEVWLCSLKHSGKTLINCIWRDLTEKKKAENVILKNITEKEILLKEIHHRVKNNLQIICSLLNLQSSAVNNETLKQILQQSKYRIESMAKIHEMLYKTNDMSKINFSTYIPELIDTLIFSTKGPENNIKLKLVIEEKFFTINTAIPLGLLINEIVTNSLKHGIKGNEKGEISISIKKKSDMKLTLRIGDNGIGYKNNFVANDITTLGFQLILSLVEQLNGKIEKEKTSKGTYYNIEIEKI